ncbi:hypothetical protein MXB_5593 [Myxobolus squamalis]|nr:hypothetical protein MXB_5593 [Myxobolus squamalis]
MIKGKPLKNISDDHCPSINKNKAFIVDNLTQQFDWDEKKQNYLLLAFNLGYTIGHIPGGLLSIKYGPRDLMIFCLLSSTILTAVSIAATINFWVFFTFRVLIGLSNGPLFAIIHQTIANYAPAEERTLLLLFTHTGTVISLVIIFPLGGYLVQYVPDGWKYIFYMSIVFGFISFILWTIFVYSEPEQNHWMSDEEKNYVVKSVYPNGKPPKKTISNIPFSRIFRSPHLYILSCAHFGKSFILYMNLFGIVKFLFAYYDLTRPMAANLAVIPFLVDFIFQLIYPIFVKIMKNKGMKITNIRSMIFVIFGTADLQPWAKSPSQNCIMSVAKAVENSSLKLETGKELKNEIN